MLLREEAFALRDEGEVVGGKSCVYVWLTIKKLVLVLVFADDIVVGGEVGVSNVLVLCRWSAVCDQLLVGLLEGSINGG